jgi:chemotaxis family two-component system sensor kinase Cph1
MMAPIVTEHTATTIPDGGEHYSTLRHGLDISNCDSEPVRTPGCVQAHGALLVVRLSDLCIVQVSDNVKVVLGQTVEAILHERISIVIGADGEERLLALLTRQQSDCNPLYLLTLPGHHGDCTTAALDVTAHTIDGVAILEFESTGRLDPVNADSYSLVRRTIARLQTANSLLHLCTMAAEEIRHLTGMDRVMVYKFHPDGHGEVFAESKRADLAPWIGMHYPAEDIPKPARALFSKTWLRPIPDMSDALAEMVPLANPDTNRALDMTYCYLRGVSKMCTEYYRNMGVAATLTMSIRRGDQLWGLFSCTYSAAPKYLSYRVRAACEFLAQLVSVQHNATEDKEHAHYRQALDRVHQQLLALAARDGSVSALVGAKPSLLDGIDATGVALYVDGQWSFAGSTPSPAQVQALGKWLVHGETVFLASPVYTTDNLARDYSPAAAFANVASGLMAFQVLPQARDLVLWFRPETMQTVKWGGNPHDKPMVPGPNGPRLTPRASFEAFVESVRNRSLPWKQVELDAAAKLQAQLTELVTTVVDQRSRLDEELMRTNSVLEAFKSATTRGLIEPLRGIRQYASQLQDDVTLPAGDSSANREHMLRLASRMDALLDSLLYFSTVGTGSTMELVDMNEIVAEAVEMVCRSTGSKLNLTMPCPLPLIVCHRNWVLEILVNLVSNAMHFNDHSPQRVVIGAISANEVHVRPGCPDSERNNTIYYVADDGIGIDPRSFAQIFKLFKRLHGREEYGGGTGTGLTVVRKLVGRHGGKVWLTSTPGEGSTFYFTLPDAQAP